MEIKPMVLLTPNPVAVEVRNPGRAYCDKCQAVTDQYVSSIDDADGEDADEGLSSVEGVSAGTHRLTFWWRCTACEELDGSGTYATLLAILMKTIEDSGLLKAS